MRPGLILPIDSITSSRECDEDLYVELTRFKKQLQAMFFAVSRQEVLFLEHVSPRDLQRKRHFAIECIPIPRAAAAQADGAPTLNLCRLRVCPVWILVA